MSLYLLNIEKFGAELSLKDQCGTSLVTEMDVLR